MVRTKNDSNCSYGRKFGDFRNDKSISPFVKKLQLENMQHNSTANSTYIPPSVYSNDYTYVEGAWMCIRWMYPIHIGFAYLVALMGIGAMITRLFNPIKFLHVWFGRFFLIFMFCTMASSLVIFNTGLPTAIMIFFVILTISQSVGWLAIKIHEMIMNKQAMEIVQKKIIKMATEGVSAKTVEKSKQFDEESKLEKNEKQPSTSSDEDSEGNHSDPNQLEENHSGEHQGPSNDAASNEKHIEEVVSGIDSNFNLQKEIGIAKGQIAGSKGFFGRFFSMKSLHALGMFIAWWNIFGRAAVTDPGKWQGCWAYPAYKDTTGNVQFVQELKDGGTGFISNVPLFVAVAFLPGFLGFVIFGFIWSLIAGLIALYKQKKNQIKK